MTIKELENRTGMTRANIRFYEGEGLLTPKRLSNGYRDYSEEDAAALEKIKLLRQLQLDIDTIRKVQGGALTLEQALFVQTTKLEGDKAVIERAAQVCRELQQTCVEYAALEPQPWLRQLEAPQLAALPEAPPAVPEDGENDEWEPQACYCPWQRYFARVLDMFLYSTFIHVLWLVLLRDLTLVEFQRSTLGGFVFGLVVLAFTLAVEPLWLHFWGWTPGKWVFGLKLRDKDGKKLPLAWGLDRSWRLLQDGYGWSIPFYSLWRLWRNRKDALDGGNGSWNDEHACRYTKEERRFGGWIFAGAQAVCITALALALLYVRTPVNQGPLTAAEFAENYNYYLKQLADQNFSGLPTLGGNGRWIEREQYGVNIIHLFGGTTLWARAEFTLTDGFVTAVTLRMESEDTMVSTGIREMLALLALSGSAEGTDLFRYDRDGWIRTAEENLVPWENVELDYRGLHISQQVEYSGYQAVSGGLFYEDENIPRHCEKTVTISLCKP